MQVYNYYRIDCISKNELSIVKEYFSKLSMDVQIDDLHILAISNEAKKEQYEINDEISHLSIALADTAPLFEKLGRELVVSGTIDTSDVSGEYMDFEIKFKKTQTHISYSDWYSVIFLEDYDSYEDLIEVEGEICTKEYYETLEDDECYILDNESRRLVKDIPLTYTFFPSK